MSDRFFDSLGIELKEGSLFRRTIRPSGSAGAAQAPAGAESDGRRTAILSESLAKSLFPDGTSIGAKVRVGADGKQDATVIGIVADARLAKPQELPIPVLYLNYWDDPQGSPYLFVRVANGRPEQLAETVRKEVRSGAREFPLWMRTMSSQWEVALMQERLLAGTSLAFGGFGLLVAGVGLFGLLSYLLQAARPKLVFVWLLVPDELKYYGYSSAK